MRVSNIAEDRTAYDPLGVLEADPTVAVLVGEVAGQPTIRVDDRPLVDDPSDPESVTELPRDRAPAPGTRIAAVGQLTDGEVVSTAAVGVSVEERDGTAAIAYAGPLFVEEQERFVWPNEPMSFEQVASELTGAR